MTAGTGVPPEVARSAIQWWLLQQDGDMPEPQRRAWQAWRAADALHEQAWQRIVSVNERLAGLAQPQQAAIARAALAPRGPARRRSVVQTLAVLAFGAGVAWQGERRTPWRHWVADVRTARGERRRLVLEDGTQLVLNGATALDVGYGPRLRRLRLLEGEVLVTTAPDSRRPARPFIVQTAAGEAQALGTRFAVRALDGGGSRVAVFEGAVRLTPGQAAGDALVLQAGQQATLRAEGVSAPRPAHEDSTAWTEGMLVARGMPLADMLAALQPYSAARLACAPEVAQLRVSGTYPLDDVPRVLAALDALPGLRVRRLTRWWGRQEVVAEAAPR
ncbi:MAG TPA: FecR domain-containing protein [Alicycliphilus sp.]|nr:FecR domain-containing protein [Alicycliphilus sp.]